MRRIITTETNAAPAYINFTRALLCSLAINAPTECIQVNTCGWPEEERKRLTAINPNAQVVVMEMEERFRRKGRYVSADKKDFLEVVHSQGNVMVHAMMSDYDMVAHIDVDTLVRRPLDNAWQDVEENTIKVRYRPEQIVERRLQNGFYIIGVGEYTMAMMARCARKMVNGDTWYDDQKQLWKSYTAHKDHVRMIELPEKFNTRHMEPEAYVWHCCLKNKTGNDSWNAEYDHYLALAREREGT